MRKHELAELKARIETLEAAVAFLQIRPIIVTVQPVPYIYPVLQPPVWISPNVNPWWDSTNSGTFSITTGTTTYMDS